MTQKGSGKLVSRAACTVVIVASVAAIAAGAGAKIRGGAARLNSKLTATVTAPNASGGASLNLRSATKGRFLVTAKRLDPSTSYDLIVGGVKVGTLQTSRRGSARTTFSTTPGRRTSLLGFDPRGRTVLVRDAQTGSDVLVGDVPDDTPNDQACCVTNSDGETECEDVSPDPVTGVVTCDGTIPTDATGAPITSCIPDPCTASTQPPPTGSVCCINTTHDDGTETECEDLADADCAAAGGNMVQASSCDPNPCQPAPPANLTACCTSQSGSSETECEVMSADACNAVGTPAASGATTCDGDPCQTTPPPGGSACCIPQSNGETPECEDLSADACTAAGGSAPANGSTTCDPNPCP